MKKMIYQLAGLISSFALFTALLGNGKLSVFLYHQPKVPAGLEKFSK